MKTVRLNANVIVINIPPSPHKDTHDLPENDSDLCDPQRLGSANDLESEPFSIGTPSSFPEDSTTPTSPPLPPSSCTDDHSVAQDPSHAPAHDSSTEHPQESVQYNNSSSPSVPSLEPPSVRHQPLNNCEVTHVISSDTGKIWLTRPIYLPSAKDMHQISLHPLLQYSHRDAMSHPCCPILWDLRQHPASSARFAKDHKRITSSDLTQHATIPPVSYLVVTCEVFPFPWRIEAKNPRGVTILDLLKAIYYVAHECIRQYEWNLMPNKQQARIGFVFEQRWQGSKNRWGVRANGVIRVDCLLQSTGFAGLTMSCENKSSILTLSRKLK